MLTDASRNFLMESLIELDAMRVQLERIRRKLGRSLKGHPDVEKARYRTMGALAAADALSDVLSLIKVTDDTAKTRRAFTDQFKDANLD